MPYFEETSTLRRLLALISMLIVEDIPHWRSFVAHLFMIGGGCLTVLIHTYKRGEVSNPLGVSLEAQT
jgi:hypothetical protein